MKVAIVEDDKMTNEYIKNLIETIGWETKSFFSGEEFLKSLEKNCYNCAILDINLKVMSGFDVLYFIKKYHEKYGRMNTLILTSKDNQEDINTGLRLGADDYIKKPFNDEEFMLRLNALLTRNNGNKVDRVQYNETIFDFVTREVIYKKEKIKLTKTESNIMKFFLDNLNLVVTRENLYLEIWEDIYVPGNKKIEICISRLKKKLPILQENLHAYRGIGYKLDG